PPPPRGRSGRFGLLPPLAMAFTSVKASQLRPDADVPAQGAGEHPALDRAVEARQAAARVGAATRLGSAGDESAVAGREPEQVALRRPPAAAGAALAVGEDRRAAAREVLRALLAAAEGRLGLGLRELGVALDVDLPAGEARGQAGVHALLADRERELVVGNDDRRLAPLVVEVDL